MAQPTEHHPATRAEVHPADIIREIVPRQVLQVLAEALMVGNKERGSAQLFFDREPEYYWTKKANHHIAYRKRGEMWDRDDGQHHLAAEIVRDFQLIAKDIMPNGGP